MLMLVLIGCTWTGCLTGEPETATQEMELRCDSFCGPDQLIEVLEATYNYGFQHFTDGTPTERSCAVVDANGPRLDRVVTFLVPSNPCGTVAVECLDRLGSALQLDHALQLSLTSRVRP